MLWECICAVDRMTSMMWSLPSATAEHSLRKRPIVDARGRVNPQSYLYTLADIASRILEVDNIYFSGRPLPELANAVTGVDRELRLLAGLTPESWEQAGETSLSIDLLLKYWHQYFTLRTHLQLALSHSPGTPFPISFQTCLEACRQVAHRYVSIRPLLPGGFFARVIDLQAFTAAIFLLLAGHRYSSASEGLLLAVERVMKSAAARVGGNVTQQAADAIHSLSTLLRQKQSSRSQEIILRLPLVGRIRVSRRMGVTESRPGVAASDGSVQPADPWPVPNAGPSQLNAEAGLSEIADGQLLNSMESFSYLMEMPDTFADEFAESDRWLTYTNWDGQNNS